MATLVVICPETLKEFSTGIGGERASLESSDYADNATECPYCGQMHSWSKEHTRVVD